MIQILPTNYILNPQQALADRLETRYPNHWALCVRGYRIWVSDIRLCENPDHTLPRNCTKGCLYVDDVFAKCCTPINHLDEIYLVERLNANEEPLQIEKKDETTAETLKSIFRANPKAILDMLERKDIEAYLKE